MNNLKLYVSSPITKLTHNINLAAVWDELSEAEAIAAFIKGGIVSPRDNGRGYHVRIISACRDCGTPCDTLDPNAICPACNTDYLSCVDCSAQVDNRDKLNKEGACRDCQSH